MSGMAFDPERDLELTRFFHAPPSVIWRCWTDPALLVKWWAPQPVTMREAVVEPFAGGRFFTMMVLPDGTEIATEGAILDCVPEQRLSFTETLLAGFRPAAKPALNFAATVTLTAEDGGTRYRVHVMHDTPETRAHHAAIGFEQGWGQVADQLGTLAKGLS
jgi:uncharacterized protein YndB with AHSA1/START domain